MQIKRGVKYLAVGVFLLTSACQYSDYSKPDSYSDQITHQQQWDHDNQTIKADRAYTEAHGGFSGSIACHTADGGCLHFSCSTEKSCDYMKLLVADCKVPTVGTDPKVLDRLIVRDDSCASVAQPTTIPSSSTGNITILGGTGTLSGEMHSQELMGTVEGQ